MNVREYIKDIHFFPFVKAEVVLPTTKHEFFNKLKKVTIHGFDWIGSLNSEGIKYRHDYQSEINGSQFKLRLIEGQQEGTETGYRQPHFIGTICYGKVIEENGKLTIKYFIIFNIFCNLFFLILLFCIGALMLSMFSKSPHLDYSWLVVFLSVYATGMFIFNNEISSDVGFVKGLVKYVSTDIKDSTSV